MAAKPKRAFSFFTMSKMVVRRYETVSSIINQASEKTSEIKKLALGIITGTIGFCGSSFLLTSNIFYNDSSLFYNSTLVFSFIAAYSAISIFEIIIFWVLDLIFFKRQAVYRVSKDKLSDILTSQNTFNLNVSLFDDYLAFVNWMALKNFLRLNIKKIIKESLIFLILFIVFLTLFLVSITMVFEN